MIGFVAAGKPAADASAVANPNSLAVFVCVVSAQRDAAAFAFAMVSCISGLMTRLQCKFSMCANDDAPGSLT